MYPLAGEEGLEPPTPRLTAVCSNQLSYTPILATSTGLEPVTSGVTGQRSNHLSYGAI